MNTTVSSLLLIPCVDLTTQSVCTSSANDTDTRCIWDCQKNGICSCIGRPSEDDNTKVIIGVVSVAAFLFCLALVIFICMRVRTCSNLFYNVHHGKLEIAAPDRVTAGGDHGPCTKCCGMFRNFMDDYCCCCFGGSSLKGNMVSEGHKEGTFGKRAQTTTVPPVKHKNGGHAARKVEGDFVREESLNPLLML